MADVPDQLTLRRNRDREGMRDPLIRRALLGVICVVVALGLLNVFGQRPETTSVGANAAQLSVYAPTRVRGGLYYEARFHVRANRELRNATLVLDSGWTEGLTINTIEPSPVGEGSENGKLVLELGHVPASHSHLLYLQMQVNPTNIGRRDQNVELRDGDEHLLTVERTITVFP